jgi:hypothetical protein
MDHPQFAPIDKPYMKKWQARLEGKKRKPVSKAKRQHHTPARKQAKRRSP